MNNVIYWIWLQNALKVGSSAVSKIVSAYRDIRDFYNAGEKEWRLSGYFTNRELTSLVTSKVSHAISILQKSVSLGYRMITPEDSMYPKRLRNIKNFPCVIYVKGDVSLLNEELSISIVGTRNATQYGIYKASEISYDLSKKGIIIVSGGALGIDSAVHRATLNCGGKTIVVLGCGINYNYLSENKILREKVSENGAVISEYPPDYPVFPCNFPIRNRIISGISCGTIVVEADIRSGALLTAKLAKKQGRDVFVVRPDDVNNMSRGVEYLIKNGAKLFTGVRDILSRYDVKDVMIGNEKMLGNNTYTSEYSFDMANSFFDPGERNQVQNENYDIKNRMPKEKFEMKDNFYGNDSQLKSLSKNSMMIYMYLKEHGRSHIDKISMNMNIPTKNILAIITELEIKGLIKSYPGRIYGIK